MTEVDLSHDMRNARSSSSILGEDQERVADGAAPGHRLPRRGLARRAGLRFTPELRFEIDTSIDGGFRIDKLLGEISDARPSTTRRDDDTPGEEENG